MSDKFKETYRGYLIDHHSPDPPIVTLENLDVNEYKRFFEEANISNLMVYMKDHWGVTYYDTKVGKRHLGLKEDWIKKLVPVLRELDIEYNAYYCLEYDNHACISHPEWSTLKADKSPLTCAYSKAKWKMPCYETPYRKYVLEQLKEIVKGYGPDSLFLDIFGKSLCYCDACKKKFKKRFNYDLPETEEGLVKNNKDIVDFLDDCAKEMLGEIIETVKSIDPTIKVTINFAALYKKEIRDMLDYQFTEPWAGNFLSAAYARDTQVNQYPQLGPGDVSEVYNYRHENIYDLAVAQIVANGCRSFIYSGSQHPDGTLEHIEAKKVGFAYEHVELFEEHLKNRKVIAEVSIVQDDFSASLVSSKSVASNAIARVKEGSEHRNSVLGAMKICSELKWPWKVVPKQQMTYDEMKKYKMILLPDVYYIEKDFKDNLIRYVKEGGKILASNKSGMYNQKGEKQKTNSLKELLGVDYCDTQTTYKDSEWGAYLNLEYFTNSILSTTTPPVSSVFDMVNLENAKSLSEFVNPATKLTKDKWVNWWCPPPKTKTDYPAITLNELGDGECVYFAFEIFKMMNEGFNLVTDIIDLVSGEISYRPTLEFETRNRHILDYVAYKKDNEDKIIVHVLSNMAMKFEGDITKIQNGKLKLFDEYKSYNRVSMVYPSRKEIKVDKEDECIIVNLVPIDLHQIYILEK